MRANTWVQGASLVFLAWFLIELPAVSVGIVVAADAVAADKITGVLSVHDVLTIPGRPARIEARLVGDSLLRRAGLGGERLELLVGGKTVTTAMTGGDGRAFFEYAPPRRGNHVMTVRLADNKRVTSPEATATLAVWERRRPILLVEAAALVERAAGPKIPLLPVPLEFGGFGRRGPAPDAAEELTRLTKFFYNVIYLSWSDSGTPVRFGKREGLPEWLGKHKFPAGLRMSVDPGREALATKIEDMKAGGWTNFRIGIGRTKTFAEVLVEHRIGVIIMPASEEDEELPRKAQVAKNWKEVRKKL